MLFLSHDGSTLRQAKTRRFQVKLRHLRERPANKPHFKLCTRTRPTPGAHLHTNEENGSPSPRGPQFAKRTSSLGKLTRGGLGKPLGRGEGEHPTDLSCR